MNQFLQTLYDLTFGQVFPDLGPTYQVYIKTAFFLVLALALGFVIRQVLLSRLGSVTKKTENFYDDLIVQAIRKRTVLWVVLIAAMLSIPTLPWDPVYKTYGVRVIMALFVVSITFTLVRTFAEGMKRFSTQTGSAVGGTSLIRYTVSIVFYVLGLAVVLSLFDVSLLPALTALGVGGLAVALAFQDTLANLFAGIYITLSQQIRIGDYVEISPTEQGFVYDIGWRSTTLQTLATNLVIIPNKKFAESTMTNYTLPETELSVELSVGVSYDDDPQRVEEILKDIVHVASSEVEGVLDKVPAIRFTQFGDFSLAVFAYVRVDKVEHRYAARHELMKRIYTRFKAEGIHIPFPIRTIQFADGNGEDRSRKVQNLVGSGAASPDDTSDRESDEKGKDVGKSS